MSSASGAGSQPPQKPHRTSSLERVNTDSQSDEETSKKPILKKVSSCSSLESLTMTNAPSPFKRTTGIIRKNKSFEGIILPLPTESSTDDELATSTEQPEPKNVGRGKIPFLFDCFQGLTDVMGKRKSKASDSDQQECVEQTQQHSSLPLQEVDYPIVPNIPVDGTALDYQWYFEFPPEPDELEEEITRGEASLASARVHLNHLTGLIEQQQAKVNNAKPKTKESERRHLGALEAQHHRQAIKVSNLQKTVNYLKLMLQEFRQQQEIKEQQQKSAANAAEALKQQKVELENEISLVEAKIIDLEKKKTELEAKDDYLRMRLKVALEYQADVVKEKSEFDCSIADPASSISSLDREIMKTDLQERLSIGDTAVQEAQLELEKMKLALHQCQKELDALVKERQKLLKSKRGLSF